MNTHSPVHMVKKLLNHLHVSKLTNELNMAVRDGFET